MVSRARPNAGRRNAAIAAATGVIAGLLFVYPTSLGNAVGAGAAPALGSVTAPGTTGASSAGVSSSGSAGGGSTSSGSDSGTTAGGKTGTTSGSTATGATRTITGSSVNTRYGPVQVQLTIRGSRITSAAAIEYPTSNGRDREINSYAVPQLNAEVVAAQSAGIDTVSGATYTSDGYLKSLQSALDAAHLS
jgi:uncharacterized protein with FMN-binding domain